MAIVTYPVSLDTDLKKLAAIYNLREQFRLEHNRQGAIARSDWQANKGKWKAYTNLYRQAVAPIGAEYVRLREASRKIVYPDLAKWKETRGRPRTPEFLANIFGNREQLKGLTTLATVDTLGQLKAIDLNNLAGVVIDPYEDWTTYTETDPNSILTVAANQITFAGMTRASACTVYADKGASHFGATFQHLIDTRLTGQSGGDFEAQCHVWGVANITNPTNATDPIIAVFWAARPTTGNAHIYLMVDDGVTDQNDPTGQIALNTMFYLTIDKNATDTDCLIYSDAARTTLVDTLTVANGATAYQYMHSAFPRGGSGTGTVSGDIYNLDLQEAGGTTEYITPTGSGTPAGAIIHKPKTIWAGGITPPGSIINKISTIYSGSDTPSGITTKKPLTSYAGNISTSASLASKVSSILSGTIAIAASIIYKVGNVTAGTVSSIGSILWKGSVSYTGSGSTSGSVSKKPSVSYAGSIATSAIDVLKASKSFVGSIASSSTMVYKVGKAISGVISLSASIIRKVSHILSGIASSVGSLTNVTGETVSLIIGGTVSLAGTISRKGAHILSSSISLAGSLTNSSILLRLKNFVLSFPLRAITCFVFRRNYVSISPTVTHTMTLETHDKSLVLLVPSRSITVIVRGDNQ